MKRTLNRSWPTAMALAAICQAAPAARAHVGPVEWEGAQASYNPLTGEIWVSVALVNNWYVESATSAFTGAEPTMPSVAGSLVTNNDTRVGQGTFYGYLTYVDQSLGPVAAPGLPLSDLSLKWSGSSRDERTGPIVIYIPEPGGAALFVAAMGLAAMVRGRRP